MKLLIAIAAALCLGGPAAADPAPQPVVVELFTSQGCSSCPPADALLHKLAQREDVLPLALHVDYWDYIGWKDAFADPSHTLRQKGYAHAAGRHMIYTPQAIVMGNLDVLGADAIALADAIMAYKGSARPVSIELRRAGGKIELALHAEKPLGEGKFLVQLVGFSPLKSVSITRGELAGRTLDYANVVEDWQVAAEWDGQDDLRLALPLPGSQQAAVLVQRAPFGPILAAARAGGAD